MTHVSGRCGWSTSRHGDLQAAQSLWNEGRHADALDLYAEAIRQEPNNVRTYVQAARAYAETYDFDRMTQTHEKLIRRSPRHPGVHHYIGETFDLLKLPQRAIASFQRAVLLPGAGPVTWMELASLYERLRTGSMKPRNLFSGRCKLDSMNRSFPSCRPKFMPAEPTGASGGHDSNAPQMAPGRLTVGLSGLE